MKKIIGITALVFLLGGSVFVSCNKTSSVTDEPIAAMTQEERSMVTTAGFNGNWVEKTADGNYLIEGDILLSRTQLQEMSGVAPANELIIANEEHYRTTNLVNTGGGVRVITVRLGSGFPSYYSTGLDQALARYNSLSLTIQFLRVSSGGEIVISAANLGRVPGGGCVLGQASGFPSGGNPSSGFTLSNNKCATSYLNTADKADEVMAHEIGHCIGFRHTDYISRASCGQNSNEGDAGVGAIHILGTPTTVAGNYNSWMMACTNGSPIFNGEDVLALQTIY
ncbi:MAG: M57 family metalloprotease [Bacteroidota bacterium]|nr:M57 family metalloprotease [Bacteroidota bacterium]